MPIRWRPPARRRGFNQTRSTRFGMERRFFRKRRQHIGSVSHMYSGCILVKTCIPDVSQCILKASVTCLYPVFSSRYCPLLQKGSQVGRCQAQVGSTDRGSTDRQRIEGGTRFEFSVSCVYPVCISCVSWWRQQISVSCVYPDCIPKLYLVLNQATHVSLLYFVSSEYT